MPSQNEYIPCPHQIHFFNPDNSSLLTLVRAAEDCHKYNRAFEIAFNTRLPINPQSLKNIVGEYEYDQACAQIRQVWQDSSADLLSPKYAPADKKRIRNTYLESAQRIMAFLALIGQANPELGYLVLYEPKTDPTNVTVIPLKGTIAFKLASQLAITHTSQLINDQMNTLPSADPLLPVQVETPKESYAQRLARVDRFRPRVDKTALYHANTLPTRGSAK